MTALIAAGSAIGILWLGCKVSFKYFLTLFKAYVIASQSYLMGFLGMESTSALGTGIFNAAINLGIETGVLIIVVGVFKTFLYLAITAMNAGLDLTNTVVGNAGNLSPLVGALAQVAEPNANEGVRLVCVLMLDALVVLFYYAVELVPEYAAHALSGRLDVRPGEFMSRIASGSGAVRVAGAAAGVGAGLAGGAIAVKALGTGAGLAGAGGGAAPMASRPQSGGDGRRTRWIHDGRSLRRDRRCACKRFGRPAAVGRPARRSGAFPAAVARVGSVLQTQSFRPARETMLKVRGRARTPGKNRPQTPAERGKPTPQRRAEFKAVRGSSTGRAPAACVALPRAAGRLPDRPAWRPRIARRSMLPRVKCASPAAEAASSTRVRPAVGAGADRLLAAVRPAAGAVEHPPMAMPAAVGAAISQLPVGARLRPVVKTQRIGKQQAGSSRAAAGHRRRIRHITVRRTAGKRGAAVKTAARSTRRRCQAG